MDSTTRNDKLLTKLRMTELKMLEYIKINNCTNLI